MFVIINSSSEDMCKFKINLAHTQVLNSQSHGLLIICRKINHYRGNMITHMLFSKRHLSINNANEVNEVSLVGVAFIRSIRGYEGLHHRRFER